MGDFDFTKTSFEMTGFAELYRAIDHLPEVVKARELEPVVTAALEPIRDTARALAPDDPLTGPPWNLNTSIEVGTRQRSGRAKHDRALGQYDARAYVGPTKYGYPQAIFEEFGTVHAPAWPYMRPAWDAHKQAALEIIKVKLGTRLREIAQKYGPSGG